MLFDLKTPKTNHLPSKRVHQSAIRVLSPRAIQSISELTVNWHILEQCNYKCNFCYAVFNQMKPEFPRDYVGILRELATLRETMIEFRNVSVRAGSVRLNFAGGEPFLFLGRGFEEAIALSHRLGLSPSFISNGTLVTDDFIRKCGPMISVAGFSIDSFDTGINERIGRQDKKTGLQVGLKRFREIFSLFREVSPRTRLKINTVICRENVDEDLTEHLLELRPDRWKALRVVPVHGATGRGITDEQYRSFLDRHQGIAEDIVHEDNDDMHRSYVILDPGGRFYQRNGVTCSEHSNSNPIAEVGAVRALRDVELDVPTYLGRYDNSMDKGGQ